MGRRRKLNLSPAHTAGTTLGFKHNSIFKLNRKGSLDPMFGVGVKKYPATIAKLQKLVYVYEVDTLKLIGVFPTLECNKHFKMAKDTLTKYLNSKLPFKGKIFSRVQLD